MKSQRLDPYSADMIEESSSDTDTGSDFIHPNLSQSLSQHINTIENVNPTQSYSQIQCTPDLQQPITSNADQCPPSISIQRAKSKQFMPYPKNKGSRLNNHGSSMPLKGNTMPLFNNSHTIIKPEVSIAKPNAWDSQNSQGEQELEENMDPEFAIPFSFSAFHNHNTCYDRDKENKSSMMNSQKSIDLYLESSQDVPELSQAMQTLNTSQQERKGSVPFAKPPPRKRIRPEEGMEKVDKPAAYQQLAESTNVDALPNMFSYVRRKPKIRLLTKTKVQDEAWVSPFDRASSSLSLSLGPSKLKSPFISLHPIPSTSPFLTHMKKVLTPKLQRRKYVIDFQEIQVLGKGDFSTVASARNKMDGQLYAVKRTSRPLHNAEMVAQALREVHALAALNSYGSHPNVLKYFSSWMEQKCTALYIQIELLESARSVFPLEESLDEIPKFPMTKLITQLLSALEYVHSHEICHMDVKPDNILIRRRFQSSKSKVLATENPTEKTKPCSGYDFVLSDFGLACRMDATDIPHFEPIEGDCRYLCPSSLELGISGFVDKYGSDCLYAIDMFAFGMTCIHVCLPRLLAERQEASAVRQRVIRGELLDPESVLFQEIWNSHALQQSKMVMDIVCQCVAVDPRNRPSASALLQQLARCEGRSHPITD